MVNDEGVATLLKTAAWALTVGAAVLSYVKPIHVVNSDGTKKITFAGYIFFVATLLILVVNDSAADFSNRANDAKNKRFISDQQNRSIREIALSKDSIIKALASQYNLYYDSNTKSFDKLEKNYSDKFEDLLDKSLPEPVLSATIGKDGAGLSYVYEIKPTGWRIDSLYGKIHIVVDASFNLGEFNLDNLQYSGAYDIDQGRLSVNSSVDGRIHINEMLYDKVYFYIDAYVIAVNGKSSRCQWLFGFDFFSKKPLPLPSDELFTVQEFVLRTIKSK